jgi:hypothetical protein
MVRAARNHEHDGQHGEQVCFLHSRFLMAFVQWPVFSLSRFALLRGIVSLKARQNWSMGTTQTYFDLGLSLKGMGLVRP